MNVDCLSHYKESVMVVAERTLQRRSGENCRNEKINIYLYTVYWVTQFGIETVP